jgi:EutQ-like cupin domain
VRAALADLEATLPGLFDHNEPDNPGMHTTVTIDFEYVLSGRVVLELDDGATVELGPGDTVVQNGTATPGATRSTRPPPSSSC